MTSTTKVVLGILGAAAAGVVIGLLIAPEKGSEMRARIKKTTGGWVDQLGDLINSGREQYDDLKDKARNIKATTEQKVSRMNEDLG